MAEPPKDHTDLAAVTEWVTETVQRQESKGARHIMIPITMMRTLLRAGDAVTAHSSLLARARALARSHSGTPAKTVGDGEDCLYCGTSAATCSAMPGSDRTVIQPRCCASCEYHPAAHLSGHERGDKS